ncbi:hypothetical protein V6N13_064290 [Hibiscus sabdariffa]
MQRQTNTQEVKALDAFCELCGNNHDTSECGFIQKNDAFMDRTEMKLQNHDATLKSLETQVGQISQILNTRPIGGFPRDTEVAKGATHEQSTDAPAKADEPAKAEEDHNDPTNTQTEESLAEPSHTKSDKLEKIRPPHHFHKG